MGVKGEEVFRMRSGFLTLCYWKVSFTETGNTGRRPLWGEMGRWKVRHDYHNPASDKLHVGCLEEIQVEMWIRQLDMCV